MSLKLHKLMYLLLISTSLFYKYLTALENYYDIKTPQTYALKFK